MGIPAMDTPRSARESIEWQARHCRENNAPITARIVTATLPLPDGQTLCGQRMAAWHRLSLEAATPLRIAAGLHHLSLTGDDDRLDPIYRGAVTDQNEVDRIVATVVADHDARLVRWFDSPPQTNEAGRSAAIVAALLWLSQRLGPRFELNEIGCSAGANTMIDRYRYDLGGTKIGPLQSPVLIRPKWEGPAPTGALEIVAITGCDRAPIDLSDEAAAMRLRSYCWPENHDRLARLDGVIAVARQRAPDIVAADAADWIAGRLVQPQERGVTRVLYHSIVWQYLSHDARTRIEQAMEEAGAQADADRPLAWIMLETNRETFRHEVRVRTWPGQGDWTLLGEAHAHGAWVRWTPPADQG